MEFLVVAFSEVEVALRSFASPQYRAFLWLSENGDTQDQAKITIQKYALATLYFVLGGRERTGSKGWLESEDICLKEAQPGDWQAFGLQCLGSDRLQQIMFLTNNLIGTVPPEIKLFDKLLTLDLSGNQIEGFMDDLVSLLSNPLRELNLGSNRNVGTLPTGTGYITSLQLLSIEGNPLTGSLPSEIGHLIRLTTLVMENCLFMGRIPMEIGNLSMLQQLNTRDVSFVGPIPETIKGMSALTHLELAGAYSMSGTLPQGLYELTKLTAMKLTRMGVHSPISSAIGNLVKLTHFEVGFSESLREAAD